MEKSRFTCADCMKDAASMNPCVHCGSIRTVLRSVIESIEWKDDEPVPFPPLTATEARCA